jgi:hypothetical protein
MDPTGTAYMYTAGKDFPRDITILANHASIVYENETRADASTGVYTHHLFFADVSKSKLDPLVCKEGTPAASNLFSLNAGAPISVFSGSAEDDVEMSYVSTGNNFNTGYYVASGDKILFSADLVNYRPYVQDVFVSVELEYLKSKPTNFADTHMSTINVGMCNGTDGLVKPPPGVKKFSVLSKEMTASKNLRFMNLAGHLHGECNFRT